MKSELVPMVTEKGLARLENETGVVKVGKTLYALHPEKFENIDAISVYESRDKRLDLLCSVEEVQKLREHLEWLYMRDGFNVLYIQTKSSPKFTSLIAMIRDCRDLTYYVNIMEEELAEGRFPLMYSISRTINIDKSVRFGRRR